MVNAGNIPRSSSVCATPHIPLLICFLFLLSSKRERPVISRFTNHSLGWHNIHPGLPYNCRRFRRVLVEVATTTVVTMEAFMDGASVCNVSQVQKIKFSFSVKALCTGAQADAAVVSTRLHLIFTIKRRSPHASYLRATLEWAGDLT